MKELRKISKGLRVLYVEDDDDARSSTLEMLENFFTDIVTAVDGEDALEKFYNNTFDLIISDINMPRLNGIEMLRKIRKDDDEIPVLILSAYNESEYFLETIKLNVDGYILKPLESRQFLASIKKVIEKVHLKKEAVRYKVHLEEELQARTQELERRLHYDGLTGLFNRYSFFEDIKEVALPIVFIIDIDKFNVINEIYGTSVGSQVLKDFSSFLLEFTAESSYQTYRISADEFILWDDVDYIDPEKYEHDIARFFRLLSEFQVVIGDDTIFIEATIGISTSHKEAYESAKIALDFAKSHRRPYAMYSSAIDKRDKEQDALVWKERVKCAIEDKRLYPVYQPIVDSTGHITKHETLMRIKDETTQKLISPFFFLDIDIKTGLYDTLSKTIIFEALHLLEGSQQTLSMNFTYSDIKNSDLMYEIEKFFKTRSELGSRAVFEITESESIENYDDVKKFIRRFRKYGIRIAIDDFGSGFSNFEYILEIEPDYLKIDGSLVKNIDSDERSYILVKAITHFSHELGIKVICEYVHNEKVFAMLKALDVDEYQGFYFSEPLEAIESERTILPR